MSAAVNGNAWFYLSFAGAGGAGGAGWGTIDAAKFVPALAHLG